MENYDRGELRPREVTWRIKTKEGSWRIKTKGGFMENQKKPKKESVSEETISFVKGSSLIVAVEEEELIPREVSWRIKTEGGFMEK